MGQFFDTTTCFTYSKADMFINSNIDGDYFDNTGIRMLPFCGNAQLDA